MEGMGLSQGQKKRRYGEDPMVQCAAMETFGRMSPTLRNLLHQFDTLRTHGEARSRPRFAQWAAEIQFALGAEPVLHLASRR